LVQGANSAADTAIYEVEEDEISSWNYFMSSDRVSQAEIKLN